MVNFANQPATLADLGPRIGGQTPPPPGPPFGYPAPPANAGGSAIHPSASLRAPQTWSQTVTPGSVPAQAAPLTEGMYGGGGVASLNNAAGLGYSSTLPLGRVSACRIGGRRRKRRRTKRRHKKRSRRRRKRRHTRRKRKHKRKRRRRTKRRRTRHRR